MMDILHVVVTTFVLFIFGSMPLALWLIKVFLDKDIRAVGDHNPGAFNAVLIGGKWLGALAIVLEFMKGFIPLLVVVLWLEPEGWLLVLYALMPVLGHAFSPFLRFRGGKAIAVTFGIWGAITYWVVPTILGLCLALGLIIAKSRLLIVVISLALMVIPLWIIDAPWSSYVILVLNILIVGFKHLTAQRHNLSERSIR